MKTLTALVFSMTTTNRRPTKSDFARELRKEPEATLPLRFTQLCNEYPYYSALIIAAFAKVAAESL